MANSSIPTRQYLSYIGQAKSIAEKMGLEWKTPVDELGVMQTKWDLDALVKAPSKSNHLRKLGHDSKTLQSLNERLLFNAESVVQRAALSEGWQELIKAAAINYLLVKRIKPASVVGQIIRPLRAFATCMLEKEPWDISAVDVKFALELTKPIQKSGVLSERIFSLLKCLFDRHSIAYRCPLTLGILEPATDTASHRLNPTLRSQTEILETLESRVAAEKLPEKKSYWELSRIVFTERPRTFGDAILFAQIKILLLTGLRVGEVARLPVDWCRYVEFFDYEGSPAGDSGGISKALQLRHFAEKQGFQTTTEYELYESVQHVPKEFEAIITEILNEVAVLTSPLRKTLKRQYDTGRILPQYEQDALVSVVELYAVLSGNPVWLALDEDVFEAFQQEYLTALNVEVLEKLMSYQNIQHDEKKGRARLNMAMYQYFTRLGKGKTLKGVHYDISFRNSKGEISQGRRDWNNVYLNVGELEAFIRNTIPTKLSDTQSVKLNNGQFHPWEYLFLTPKRALAAERNEGLCHIGEYFSVGTPSSEMIVNYLGESKSRDNIFFNYGRTDDDKNLFLISHSARHLLNTELFRLGVTEAIITKHFNRRDIAQSEVYNHMTLADKLNEIEVPLDAHSKLGMNGTYVAKLIIGGFVSGPIAETFRKTQKESGDDAAFEYLRGEADAFHVTPYGFCFRSFTVEPCPKQLECFNNCNQLSATDNPQNIIWLNKLESRIETRITEIKRHDSKTVGWQNQLRDAESKLEALRKIKNTRPGKFVFPKGENLFEQTKKRTVLDEF